MSPFIFKNSFVDIQEVLERSDIIALKRIYKVMSVLICIVLHIKEGAGATAFFNTIVNKVLIELCFVGAVGGL